MADTATVEQVNTTGSDNNQGERTFTQEEVNAIVEGRVAKERSRYADYESLQEKASKFDEMEEANKSELQKATEKAEALEKELTDLKNAAEVRSIRDTVSSETGVPASLLTASTAEECKAQAEAILAFKSQNAAVYPSVKDGGEIQNTAAKKTAQDQFADWFNASLSN